MVDKDDPASEPLTSGKMALYCFAASVPFKVGSASIAAEAFYIAISIESTFGWHVGWVCSKRVVRKKFALLLAFTYWWPSPNKRSGEWCQPNDYEFRTVRSTTPSYRESYKTSRY